MIDEIREHGWWVGGVGGGGGRVLGGVKGRGEGAAGSIRYLFNELTTADNTRQKVQDDAGR